MSLITVNVAYVYPMLCMYDPLILTFLSHQYQNLNVFISRKVTHVPIVCRIEGA